MDQLRVLQSVPKGLSNKCLAVDMWMERFGNCACRTAGRDFRREILARGSSRSALDSLEAFMRRKPDLKAIVKCDCVCKTCLCCEDEGS
mmetsp:Transcript_388/g.631  ORF Transcript_388/g.631 Transcript_388/m.631 type:complete len:89 (-) Transcript_388:27-293(-)